MNKIQKGKKIEKALTLLRDMARLCDQVGVNVDFEYSRLSINLTRALIENNKERDQEIYGL